MRDIEDFNSVSRKENGNGNGHGHGNGGPESRGEIPARVNHLLNGGVAEVCVEDTTKNWPASQGKKSRKVVEFAKGWIDQKTPVELIEDPKNPARMLFAVRREDGIEIAARLEQDGMTLVPPARQVAPFYKMHLPTGVSPYGAPQELATECGEFIHSIVPLSDQNKNLFSAIVLNSWCWERLPFAVCPTVFGPPDFTDYLLRAMALLCNYPVIVAGASALGILEVCTGLGATLFLESDSLGKKALEAIDAGAWPDGYFLQHGRTLSAFCLKIIAASEGPGELNSLCGEFGITLSLLEFPKWSKLYDFDVLMWATELRNRLLQFKFDHVDSMRIPKDAEGYSYPKLGMITGVLVAPFADDLDYCQELAGDLEEMDLNKTDRLPAYKNAVASATFYFAHDRKATSEGEVPAKGLSEMANTILKERGEPCTLNPRRVGEILTGLGFPKRTRDSRGYRLDLDLEVLERVHHVAKYYSVFDPNPYDSRGPKIDCPICRKYALVEGYTTKGYNAYEAAEEERRQRRAEIKKAAQPQGSPRQSLVTDELLAKLRRLEGSGVADVAGKDETVKGVESVQPSSPNVPPENSKPS
jgi:hypothetical protein